MSNAPIVLFRHSLAEEEEWRSCECLLPTVHSRSQVPKDSLVIGRYSVLPFYKELEEDLAANGSELINSYAQHRYVADIRNWYLDLVDITPQTWFTLASVPKDGGPFVLKGCTNSKKHYWNTHMYAADFATATDVYSKLQADGYIGYQDIVIREYVPLHDYLPGQGIQGLPITEEYRFFILDGKVLTGAFYWSAHSDYLQERGHTIDVTDVPTDFLDRVMERVGDNIRFYVVDVARTAAGEWIVIELNDGQMSGLSDNAPTNLYAALKGAL